MSKLVQIQVKNFRTIATTEELALQPVNVFIGGNNSGKTSVFRALLLAKFGVSTLLRRMVAPRDSLVGVSPVDPRLLTKGTMYVTQGNLSEFHDLPVGEAEELFHLRQRTNPVEVSLKWENGWGITLRFTQPSGTMVKIEPARIVKNTHRYFDGDFQVIGSNRRYRHVSLSCWSFQLARDCGP